MSPDLLGKRYFSNVSVLLIFYGKRLYNQQVIELMNGTATIKQEQLGELQVAEKINKERENEPLTYTYRKRGDFFIHKLLKSVYRK